MKYAAYTDFSIYAVAETPDAAIAAARQLIATDDDTVFQLGLVSERMAKRIERDGWDGNRQSFDVRHGTLIDTTRRG